MIAERLTVMLPLNTFMRTSGGEEAQPTLAFASLIFLRWQKKIAFRIFPPYSHFLIYTKRLLFDGFSSVNPATEQSNPMMHTATPSTLFIQI